MKLLFLGTPQFAVPSLEHCVQAGHQVLAVYTQPDRPKGRGQAVPFSPVKEAALRLGIPVHQPLKIRQPEVVDALRAFAPDVMVVVGYGQIIPQSIIDLPPHGIINVHGSLLPKYRGAAPIQWAIANGETHTGVTTMRINAGLDTGDLLLKWETAIGPEETAPELSARLAPAGAQLLVDTLARLESIRPEPQNDAAATYAPILQREDGLIDWTRPAPVILNRLRGFQPWPGAYTTLRGQRLHVARAALASLSLAPAQLHQHHRRLYAGCGHGTAIELLEVQLEGRKRLPVSIFLNGFTPAGNETLGA
jgi:methionyl-tRNA formyltransferase